MHKNNQILVHLSLLVALGLVLFLFESILPRPVPWVKPGLAHVATLLALYLYGARAALLIVVLRTAIGALILGSLFNPIFLFSLVGGLSATFAMILFKNFGHVFSVIGVSVVGAIGHNIVQLLLAYFLVVGQHQVFLLLPGFLIPAWFTGVLVGAVSYFLLRQINRSYLARPAWFGPHSA